MYHNPDSWAAQQGSTNLEKSPNSFQQRLRFRLRGNPLDELEGLQKTVQDLRRHISYSLNSLKGGISGIILGTTIGLIKGDTRSLDYSPSGVPVKRCGDPGSNP